MADIYEYSLSYVYLYVYVYLGDIWVLSLCAKISTIYA